MVNHVDTQWDLQVVERGPGWLFVKVNPADSQKYVQAPLADRVWSLLQQHFVYRVVLEMEDIVLLPSYVLGQLIVLQKRILERGGALRLCGLPNHCREALELCRLSGVFPNHQSRKDAVEAIVDERPLETAGAS